MELPLFDSILHGELRPWLLDTTDKKKFNTWVKTACAVSPANFGELHEQLSALLIDFSALQKKLRDTPSLKVSLQLPFYQPDLPRHQDAVAHFYSLLISRETLRVSNLLIQQVAKKDEDIDKRYALKQALKAVRVFATQSADELRERGFTSFPDSNSEFTHFVLFTQKQMLSALFLEMQERFKGLLLPTETEQSFYTTILQEQHPGKPILKPTLAFFEFQIQRLIPENQFSKPESLDLLTQISQYANLANLQAALENLIFLRSQNHTNHLTFDQLASPDFVAEHISLAKQATTAQLQSLQFGHERREAVSSLLDNLDYLNSSVLNKLSIPQLLHRWLSEQKEIYTARFSEKFPVTIEPTPRKRNAKAKLTFGFHGDTTKLKTVLSLLCGKVNLLNEEKNKPEELLALLTSKDVKLDSTKIYINCETRQFRYIINKLSPHFTNFSQKSIGDSGLFYSRQGKKIKAQNLYSSKIENPKDKENIDKILKQLQ